MKLLSLLSAYNSGSLGWKLDDNGNVVLKEGNPVFVNSAGVEQTVMSDTIASKNAEAKAHREAKEALEQKLKLYEGIDPEIARKAVETVSKLDAKKLIDAGEVDQLTNQIKSQFAAQVAEKDTALSSLQNRIDNMLVTSVFNGSEFVRDSIAVPRDMFEASFRSNFKVEEGKVVAYGKDGNRLYSKTRAGEFAEPDEALRLLVEMHPQKDVIMKADLGNGSGNNGGGGNRGVGRVLKRADFAKLSPAQQAETSAKIRAGEMSLTD